MFSSHRRRSLATPIVRRPGRRRRFLDLEDLPERIVLSATVYTVNLTTDSGPTSAGSGSGTTGDLRYVINQANADPNTDGSLIQFDPTVFAAPQTITLSASLGRLDLTETSGTESIDGPAAGVTVSGGNALTVFTVNPGGVSPNVTASISGLNITEGSGHLGGGVYNRGTLTLTGCTVSGNSADYGGGIMNIQYTLTLIGCTLSGNFAKHGGGGINNQASPVTLTGCTISGNSADYGGGIHNDGPLTLTGCTVSGNSATAGGGGLDNDNNAKLTLTGCTVSGNSAGASGGLNMSTGSASLVDTIVAGNTAASSPSDIGGDSASGVTGTNNLIGPGGSGGITGGTGGNIVLTDLSTLGLAPLGNYGGPTQTMALLPGSAAIGAGAPVAGVTTDQRGMPLHSPTPDIGAFQTIPLVVNTTSDAIGSPSGKLSLRQAINLANALGGAETITFDPTVFATPQTITLSASLGTLKLTETSGTETIDGPAAGVTVSGGNAVEVFSVANNVTASISGLTITGGSATSGGGVNNQGSLTLTDCTLSGNSAGDSGGVNNFGGTLTMTGCTVSGNSAANGGGMFNIGTATLTDCTLSGNSAGGNGGGMVNEGTATLTDCTLSGNSAGNNSGGLLNYATATLTDCTLSGNSAGDDAGGLQNDGTATLTGCTVSGNSAGIRSGGLYNFTGTVFHGTAALTDTIVAGNTVGSGPSDIGGNAAGAVTGTDNLIGTGGSGGITGGQGGNIVLTDLSTLGLAPLGNYGGPTQTMALLPGSAAIAAGLGQNNIATDQRGAPGATSGAIDIGAVQVSLVVESTAGTVDTSLPSLTLPGAVSLADTYADSVITFDPAVFGPSQQTITLAATLGLSNTTGTTTITGPAAGVTVSGGKAVEVFSVSANVTATLSGLTITEGSAHNGGGVYNQGTLTLTGCTASGNSAGNGGGLANYGTLTLTECTVSGNSAGNGGGLVNYGTLTLTECTVSGNSADNGGGFSNGGTLMLTGCTVSGNSAQNGGGLRNVSGPATLVDTIVAANTTSDIGGLSDSAVTGTNNLVGTGGSGGITGGTGGNIVLTDLSTLGLAPLGHYGGPTQTMALLPGSAAIAAGLGQSNLTTDQRGARATSGAIDIGAFEVQGYTLAFVSGSPQSTMISQPFAGSLVVVLTEDYANAPLPGATIDFTAPSSGASASLSAGSAVTGTNGQASVTATANAIAGAYTASASAGTGSTVPFQLTNQVTPSFAGLTDQTTAFGSTVTFTGTLAAGTQSLPAGEDVAVTVNGVTHDAPLAADGSFSAQFTRTDVVLNASMPTAYTVTYSYATDGVFLAAQGSSQLTVNPATLTAAIVGNPTRTYDGTTDATLTSANFSLSGFVGSDGFTVTQTAGTYNSKDVTTATTVTASLAAADFTPAAGTLASNYTLPTTASGAGQITPAALTISATSDTRVYNGTTTSSQVPTHGTLFGGDTVTGLAQAFTSKDVPGSGGRTLNVTAYTVNDGVGGKDYTVTTQSAAGTITPAALTISATSDTRVYNGTTSSSQLPTLGRLFGGDTVTGLSQAFASKDVLGAGGSTLMVTADTVDDGDGGRDYTVTIQGAAGTITPAPLTISADNGTMAFGGAVPALTASYAGFVGNDTPASLTSPVHLATSATDNSPAGSYAITATGASSADYAISYRDGTMTIAAYVPPANPQSQSANGFVSTLYHEVLGRGPEPKGLSYWMKRYLRPVPTSSIMRGFARSKERRGLEKEGRAPSIPLPVAYNDALRAAKQAAKQPMVAPSGPLALRKASRATVKPVGVLRQVHVHARPAGTRRA